MQLLMYFTLADSTGRVLHVWQQTDIAANGDWLSDQPGATRTEWELTDESTRLPWESDKATSLRLEAQQTQWGKETLHKIIAAFISAICLV